MHLLQPELALRVTFPADLFNTACFILPHHALLSSTWKPTLSLWVRKCLLARVIQLIETQYPGTQLPRAFALFLIMPQQEDSTHPGLCIIAATKQILDEEQCLLAAIELVIIPLQQEDGQSQLKQSHLTLTGTVQSNGKCPASSY